MHVKDHPRPLETYTCSLCQLTLNYVTILQNHTVETQFYTWNKKDSLFYQIGSSHNDKWTGHVEQERADNPEFRLKVNVKTPDICDDTRDNISGSKNTQEPMLYVTD